MARDRVTSILRTALIPSIALVALALGIGCVKEPEPIGKAGFHDDFNRASLGADWHNTGGPYAIKDGALTISDARNHPLWLKRPLPRDVRIEFDVRSDSPDGDIKVEVFGDGRSYAKTDSYTATSYVVIFGGWHNRLNVLARMNEHGEDRVVGPRRPVVQGRTYHVRIERKGRVLRAFADDELLAEMNDPNPLEGPDHAFFAINNWQSPLTFDNLKIQPM